MLTDATFPLALSHAAVSHAAVSHPAVSHPAVPHAAPAPTTDGALRAKALPADASEEVAAPAVPTRLVIRDGRRTHFVAVPDVLWVESFGNYARVHTPTARYIHRSTMARLEAQLAPAGFVRIHRTAIVNGGRVVTMRPRGSGQYEVRLDTGLRLRVSRTYRDAVSPRGEQRAPRAP